MRKQWVALLSMLGLAGSGMPARSQVLKGSAPPSKTVQSNQGKVVNGNTAPNIGGSSKLTLKQQTLRQQNQGAVNGGKQHDTMTPSAYCNAPNKARANNQLTPPPPGQAGENKRITKGSPDQNVTKGTPDQHITKGNQLVTKGSPDQHVTKGNQLVTKGTPDQRITKGNQLVTKGSPDQHVTKGNQLVTKGSPDQHVTKGNQLVTKGSQNQRITKGSAVQTTAAVPR